MKKIIFILSCVFVITILAGFVSAQAWPTNLNDGLLAYYKMNESTGHGLDSVSGDNNLTSFSRVVRGNNGLIENAYGFNRADTSYAETNLLGGLESDEGTISLWVKWDVASTIPRQRHDVFGLFTSGSTNEEELFISLDGTDVVREVVVELRLNGALAWQLITTSDYLDRFPRFQWVHLLVKQTGNNGPILYVNGNPISTQLSGPSPHRWFSDAISAGADTLAFGANRAGNQNTHNLQGKIDETGLWSRSLLEPEVSQLYNNGSGITYDPLCVDNDNDGYYANCSPFDCNDNNPQINPGAVEMCDFIDNNCDGQLDIAGACREFECADRIDNDLDSFIDKADQDCSQLQCVMPTFQKAEPEP